MHPLFINFTILNYNFYWQFTKMKLQFPKRLSISFKMLIHNCHWQFKLRTLEIQFKYWINGLFIRFDEMLQVAKASIVPFITLTEIYLLYRINRELYGSPLMKNSGPRSHSIRYVYIVHAVCTNKCR